MKQPFDTLADRLLVSNSEECKGLFLSHVQLEFGTKISYL